MEDGQIIDLFWNRDQRAIQETDGKYGRLLNGIAWNLLHSREDAEECVNDTWGRAWESMPPQRPGSLAAYLGRIVRNLSLNRWRKNHAARRGGGGIDLLLSELEECLPQPGEGVLCEEERLSGIIAAWLSGLPAGDRTLFLRRYWYGDPLERLAKARGTSANHLAVRLHRMRKKLREHLEKEGIAV